MEARFDNGIIIVLSDSWQILKAMPEDPPGTQVFGTAADNCECFILAYPNNLHQTMPFENTQEVIDGIHETLSEDQALIEVKSVISAKSKMIYSIIKTKKQPHGVQYTLTMDVAIQNNAIRVQGFFDEVGITGQRDAIVYELKRRDGTVTSGFDGWISDPYDADYRKGQFLMNISEKIEYDAMFPQHPLSTARALVTELSVREVE